jgi:hypothetical protein
MRTLNRLFAVLALAAATCALSAGSTVAKEGTVRDTRHGKYCETGYLSGGRNQGGGVLDGGWCDSNHVSCYDDGTCCVDDKDGVVITIMESVPALDAELGFEDDEFTSEDEGTSDPLETADVLVDEADSPR